MLAIQAFGLMVMLFSLVVFFFFEDSFALAETLLRVGLLCAIPAAIYLLVYALYIVLEKRQDNSNQHAFMHEQQIADNRMAEENNNVTINNIYVTSQDEANQELQNLEQDAIQSIREENDQLTAVIAQQAEELNQVQEDTKAEKAELDEHKKQMQNELEAMRAELAKQQALAAEQTTAEAAAANDQINNELLAKIAELERAMARADEVEREKAAKAAASKEARALAAAEKKQLLSRPNVEAHIQAYFMETAACFLMDRDAYKDRFGLSTYNRVVVTKREGKPDDVKHVMHATPDKLFKFCEILIDTDRFLEHPSLYPMFVELTGEGTSLVRISEKLHLMYLQFYKKDFVKDYRYKEDFENLLVTVSHRHFVKGYDFKQVFAGFPFNPSGDELTEDDMINYLKNPELQAAFQNYFPNFSDLGFENMHQALVVAFIDNLKKDLDVNILVQIIVKDANKLAKRLIKESNKPATKPRAAKPKTAM